MKNPHWGAQMDSFCKVWQKKYIEYQWLVHHSPAAVSSYKYVCVWEIREWNQSWNTEGVSMLQTVLTGGPSSLSKPSPHTLPTLEFWNLWVIHPTIFVIFWNQQANKHGQLGMVTATGQVCVGVKKLWMLFFFYSSHNHYHSRFIQGEIIGQQIFHPIFECGQMAINTFAFTHVWTKLICLHHTEPLSIQVPHQQKRMCALRDMWFVFTVYETHYHLKQSGYYIEYREL